MKTVAEIIAKQLVEIHAQKAKIEEQYEMLKKELLALDVTEVNLNNATVKVAEGVRATLDSKAVLEELGQAWVEDHTKKTEYKQVRVTYKAFA